MGTIAKSTSFLSGCWSGLGVGCGYAVFNLLWLAMLGFAAWYAYGSYTLTTHGRTVTGTVVENRVVSGEDSDSYKPVIEYKVAGDTYTFVSFNSRNPPAYEVGDRVKLRYNPATPGEARIDNPTELWLLPGILAPAALLLALAVNISFFINWRRGALFDNRRSRWN